ncbi:MAG: hypothetical protein HQL53_09515 [Magnetococcales bacterium]|nr:hypothetical protein [Magnetococcales bacterium]
MNVLRRHELWVLLLLGMTLYLVYTPIAELCFRDDMLTLPERAWFTDDLAWLKHLLSHAQSRYTFSGDSILFRPGLMFMIWLQEMLGRHNRQLLEGISLLVSGMTAYTFYHIYQKISGYKPIAALFALFIILTNAEISYWPHINPYMMGMALFAWGVWLFHHAHRKQRPEKRFRLIVGSTLLLFCSTLFHEFTAISLAMVLGYTLISNPFRNRYGVPTIVLAAGVPLLLYSGLALWSLIPTSQMSGRIVAGKATTAHADHSLIDLIQHLISQFLPGISNAYKALFPGDGRYLLFGLIVLLTVLFVVLFSRIKKPHPFRADPLLSNGMLLFSLAALFTILAGSLFGRGMAIGAIAGWYFTMTIAFLLIPVCHIVAYVVRQEHRILRRMFLVIMALWTVPTLATNAATIKLWRHQAQLQTQIPYQMVQDVTEYLERHPAYCLGGLFPAPSSPAIWSRTPHHFPYTQPTTMEDQLRYGRLIDYHMPSMTLLLQRHFCGQRLGRPLYAEIQQSNNGSASMRLLKESQQAYTAPGPHVLQSIETTARVRAQHVSVPYVPNIHGSNRQDQSKSIHVTHSWRISPGMEEIAWRVQSSDRDPIMFNSALYFDRERDSMVLHMLNNHLLVSLNNPHHGLINVGIHPMARMRRDARLRIREVGKGCLAFLDEVVVARIPSCQLAGEVHLLQWENGTPAERLTAGTERQIQPEERWYSRLKPLLNKHYEAS